HRTSRCDSFCSCSASVHNLAEGHGISIRGKLLINLHSENIKSAFK
ncbi:unnamed protein product, partial [Brassica oleracea]